MMNYQSMRLNHLSSLRQCVEIAACLIQKPLGLIPLFLQSLDNMRWSLLQKAGITQLAISVRDVLFLLRDFLLQALALGGNIDLLVVDQCDFRESYRAPI